MQPPILRPHHHIPFLMGLNQSSGNWVVEWRKDILRLEAGSPTIFVTNGYGGGQGENKKTEMALRPSFWERRVSRVIVVRLCEIRSLDLKVRPPSGTRGLTFCPWPGVSISDPKGSE